MVLIALFSLSFVKNVRWPKRYWETPAFRVLNLEEANTFFQLLGQANHPVEKPLEKQPEAILVEKPETASDKEISKVEVEKLEKPPVKKQPKVRKSPKPEQKKASSTPSIIAPAEMKSELRRCYDHARGTTAPVGKITVLVVGHPDGHLDQVRIGMDTLGLPFVSSCAQQLFEQGELTLDRPPNEPTAFQCSFSFPLDVP